MNILDKNSKEYDSWKNDKLSKFSSNIEDLMVEIRDPMEISSAEKYKCAEIISNSNLVFFEIDKEPADIQQMLIMLSGQFGMRNFELMESSDDDGVTKIEVTDFNESKGDYIPYTNKALNWHTDGYYNDVSEPILSWLLFCQNNVIDGGINKFMDHEIVYILFNENSESIEELFNDNVFTIPKNKKTGRPDISGYVFRFLTEKLHMRFSMREKNIIWEDKLRASVQLLKEIITKNDSYHVKHKLEPNQGVISNNVIHMRTSFTNQENENRLLYRLRSKTRIDI
mgnify:FL=1|tara:strand:- start:5983 stop:6831 length:849 start_codon:yes stop_codon:yes gene_type:complete